LTGKAEFASARTSDPLMGTEAKSSRGLRPVSDELLEKPTPFCVVASAGWRSYHSAIHGAYDLKAFDLLIGQTINAPGFARVLLEDSFLCGLLQGSYLFSDHH